MLQKTKSKGYTSDTLKGLLLLLPAMGLLITFFLTPMFFTVYYALTNLALTGAAAANLEFIGLDNFTRMVADPRFVTSVWRTLVFVFFSAVMGQCLVGFTLAFLMKEKQVVFRRVVGLCILAAWVTPEIVAAFALVVFFGDGGSANWIVTTLGFEPIAWLWEYPMVSVVVANVWRGTAFSMMVFQAALDDIPKAVEEAAVMDGANPVTLLFRITVPMVKGTITTNMMLVTLQTLGVFTLIFAMTGGGPGDRTMTLPIFIYQQSFMVGQLGYGVAISLVLLSIGGLASLVYVKLLDIKV